MLHILRIPQVGTPYPANGTDGHRVCEMCHKEWKMGTMVERIQPVGPSNLLNNMVQVFANTGNTLPSGNFRTPFAARHESTALCRWGVFHPEKNRNNDSRSRSSGARTSSKIPPMFLHLHPSMQPGYTHRWTYTISPTTGHHHPCHRHKRGAKGVPNYSTRGEDTPKSLSFCSPSHTGGMFARRAPGALLLY